MTPYADPAERARALYRIPSAPRRNRTLEICHGREPLLPGQRWPGEGHALAALTPGQPLRLEFAPQSFDLIILHRTLDDLATAGAGFDAQAFVDQVAALLVPGGLLAGCIHKRDRLLAALRGVTRWRLDSPPALAQAHWSVAGLRRMLARARLSEIRTACLLPHVDAPLKLVDDDARVSRFAFERELDARRRHLSPMAFQARRLAVAFGLSRRLEPAVFFWAYKPC